MLLRNSAVQNVINSLGEGAGLAVLRGFLLLCLVSGVFGFYAWSEFRGLREARAMEGAQLARNLARGRGFTTQCVRPVDLGRITRRAPERGVPAGGFPEARQAPLYPALLAAGLRIVNPEYRVGRSFSLYAPERKVIVPLGIMFSMATGWLLFLAARRLFDRQIALVAFFVFLVSDRVLADSVSGTAVPVLAFFATAASYAAIVSAMNKAGGRRPAAWLIPSVVSALCCAAAFLTDYSLGVLAPALALFAGLTARRFPWTNALAYLLVFAAAVSPWLIRNREVTGAWLGLAPRAALNESALYAGNGFDRDPDPDLNAAAVVRTVADKVRRNLSGRGNAGGRALGAGLLGCFFLVSLLHRFEREEAGALRWGLVTGLALLLAIRMAGPREVGRNFHAFLPFVILYGTAFFFVLVQRVEFAEAGWPTLAAGLLVCVAAVPALLKLIGPGPALPYPPVFPPYAAYVCELLEPEEAICTDIPWATAWYGDRTSVLLPQTLEDFRALHASRLPMSGLYLTTETGNRPYVSGLVTGPDASWLPILNRRVPERFPLPYGVDLPPGGHDQIFLTDRVRWAVPETAEPETTGPDSDAVVP